MYRYCTIFYKGSWASEGSGNGRQLLERILTGSEGWLHCDMMIRLRNWICATAHDWEMTPSWNGIWHPHNSTLSDYSLALQKIAPPCHGVRFACDTTISPLHLATISLHMVTLFQCLTIYHTDAQPLSSRFGKFLMWVWCAHCPDVQPSPETPLT